MPLRPALAVLLAAALLVAAPATGSDATRPDSESPARPATTAATPDRVTCTASVTGRTSDANSSATTLVAPNGTYDRLRSASDIAAARKAGWLTVLGDDESATPADVFVHRFSLGNATASLLDRLAAANDTGWTEAFRTVVHQPGVRFYYFGPSRCPPTLVVNATIDRGALRVVPDRANDRFYLVVDLEEAVFDPAGSGQPTTDEGVFGTRRVTLELTPEGELAETAVTVSTDFHTDDRVASLASDGLVRLSPGPQQAVRGTTAAAPGTDLGVRLLPVDAPTGPLSTTATVDRNGSFVARFDLSGVEEALYEVRVAGVEETDPTLPLVVVGNATGAAISVPDQSASDGSTLRDVRLTTTDGGFLFVRNASGGLVGRATYFGPGTHDGLDVDLRPPLRRNGTVTVVAYRDVDGDRRFDRDDRPYRTNGTVVRTTAMVTGEALAPRTTPSPTPRTTRTATVGTTATTARPTATPPSTTGNGTIPGPGTAGAALALLVATLAARRRRE